MLLSMGVFITVSRTVRLPLSATIQHHRYPDTVPCAAHIPVASHENLVSLQFTLQHLGNTNRPYAPLVIVYTVPAAASGTENSTNDFP